MGINKARPEKRGVHTRNALLSAFRDLIMDRLYDELTVADIVG